VGIESRLLESFPLRRSRKEAAEVAWLKPESTCLIMVCDPSPGVRHSRWYLIKTVTGLVGWARFQDFKDKLDLPFAD
jgi:hypothetical protein